MAENTYEEDVAALMQKAEDDGWSMGEYIDELEKLRNQPGPDGTTENERAAERAAEILGKQAAAAEYNALYGYDDPTGVSVLMQGEPGGPPSPEVTREARAELTQRPAAHTRQPAEVDNSFEEVGIGGAVEGLVEWFTGAARGEASKPGQSEITVDANGRLPQDVEDLLRQARARYEAPGDVDPQPSEAEPLEGRQAGYTIEPGPIDAQLGERILLDPEPPSGALTAPPMRRPFNAQSGADGGANAPQNILELARSSGIEVAPHRAPEDRVELARTSQIEQPREAPSQEASALSDKSHLAVASMDEPLRIAGATQSDPDAYSRDNMRGIQEKLNTLLEKGELEVDGLKSNTLAEDGLGTLAVNEGAPPETITQLSQTQLAMQAYIEQHAPELADAPTNLTISEFEQSLDKTLSGMTASQDMANDVDPAAGQAVEVDRLAATTHAQPTVLQI